MVAGDSGAGARRAAAVGLRGSFNNGGFRAVPPSIWGKMATAFEIFLIILVLVMAAWHGQNLGIAREICSYIVAALVVISVLNYSVVVSRQLAAGEPASPS